MLYGSIAAAHSSQSWGLWAAVAAVIVDSVVTICVGYKLTKTARKETTTAVEKVKPILQQELANAAVLLLPLIVQEIKKHLGGAEDETVRAISSISDKSSAV